MVLGHGGAGSVKANIGWYLVLGQNGAHMHKTPTIFSPPIIFSSPPISRA